MDFILSSALGTMAIMPADKDREPRRDRSDKGRKLEDEQILDVTWIEQHLSVFADVARGQYKLHGRGVIVVDVTKIVFPSIGHLVWYLPQSDVEDLRDSDLLKRMVRRYPPQLEMVIALLKNGGKINLYQMLMPPSIPNLN